MIDQDDAAVGETDHTILAGDHLQVSFYKVVKVAEIWRRQEECSGVSTLA